MTEFQINDPSLESQRRFIILFRRNVATYKFGFHCHIIPRYDRDMKHRIGGVRHVIKGQGVF